jgi:hypothetical protein
MFQRQEGHWLLVAQCDGHVPEERGGRDPGATVKLVTLKEIC